MRLPVVVLTVIFAFALLADICLARIIRKRGGKHRKALSILLGTTSIALYALPVWIFFTPVRESDEMHFHTTMWVLMTFLSIYISKYIFLFFDAVASLPRIWKHKRIKSIAMTGLILAIVVFIAIWWGALVNRNRIQIVEKDIFIPDLPEQFEGYRIAQFSDFHVGTYGRDTTFVSNAVAQLNATAPDMIVFTGDIVSRRTAELLPFVEPLSTLSAPDGVYSVLGNHDYGDYYDWPSQKAYLKNTQQLKELQQSMGWHMLNNSHVVISRDSVDIALIGVENVGDPPFKTYGNLTESYPDLSDNKVKILLTHNPAHWTRDIADHDDINIPLTLSGHTHAMQMSGFGISPARLRYKTWGGLYFDKSAKHQLYVNIGIGTVGMPFRIGATPEITVLTLHKENR